MSFFGRNCLEGREHIFFQYGFSRRIWKDILSKSLIAEPYTKWGVSELKGRGLKVSLCMHIKLGGGSIYYLEAKK